MSKHRNRKRSENTTDNFTYRVIRLKSQFPPYWDDGIVMYSSSKRRKNKQIYHYQYRMYRTWKHNRKTQYK